MEPNDPLNPSRTHRAGKLQDIAPDAHSEKNGPQILPEQSGNPYDPKRTREMEDPEFVWRQRYKEQQIAYGREHSGEHNEWVPPAFVRKLWKQLLISVLLFAAIWGAFHLKHPWSDTIRQFVVVSLTQNMDFQAVSVWYEGRFGDYPSFIPGFLGRNGNPAIKATAEKRAYFSPVQGKVSIPYDSTNPGLLLRTLPDTPVYALDTGQVIFAGPKAETGFTVIIRHPLGMQSTYGRLSETRVEVSDWIKGGEPIGKVSKTDSSTGQLFFALEKDGRFIDPVDVVAFD